MTGVCCPVDQTNAGLGKLPVELMILYHNQTSGRANAFFQKSFRIDLVMKNVSNDDNVKRLVFEWEMSAGVTNDVDWLAPAREPLETGHANPNLVFCST